MHFLSYISGAEAGPVPLRLFLLLGQSNMAGRGSVEACDLVPHPRVFTFNSECRWQLAVDPLHFDKPDIAGVGLASSMARALADKTSFIGLVPCAVGDTSLSQWMSKDETGLYATALARARLAARAPGARWEAVCWHQGEADADSRAPEEYPVRFACLARRLRTDLCEPRLHVLVGELGHFRQANVGMNEALRSLPSIVPRCIVVSADGLGHKGDGLHFDSASLREFGRRYARALCLAA